MTCRQDMPAPGNDAHAARADARTFSTQPFTGASAIAAHRFDGRHGAFVYQKTKPVAPAQTSASEATATRETHQDH